MSRTLAPRGRHTVEFTTYDSSRREFFVVPAHRALNRLSTFRHFLAGGDCSPTVIRARRVLLSFEDWADVFDEVTPIPRGLAFATNVLLRDAGIQVLNLAAFVNPPELESPQFSPQGRNPEWLGPLFRSIEGNRELLIRCGRGSPSAFQITDWIVRSFPNSHVAIVSESQRECSRITNRLLKFRSDALGLKGGCILPDAHQLVIGTAYSGQFTQDIEKRDNVIFPNARHAFSRDGRDLVRSASKARLIGICRQDECFSTWERDWLTALFGHAQLTLYDSHRDGRIHEPTIADRRQHLLDFLNTRPRRLYGSRR